MNSGNKIAPYGDFHLVIPAAVKFIDMSPDCLDISGKLRFLFLLVNCNNTDISLQLIYQLQTFRA